MTIRELVTRTSLPRNPVGRRTKESPSEGQRTIEMKPLRALRLAEKIPANLHTLFVGISPATRSARIGHYYGGRSNYFWKLFHGSGIWPVPLKSEDDDKVVEKGFGFTDLARRPAPGSSHLSRSEFADSRRRLREVVRRFGPKTVVFVGKRAASVFTRGVTADIQYGAQDWNIDGAAVFFLPSTSGASLGHAPYEIKLRYFRELRAFIARYYGVTRKS
jgi:TDG/mug DNA glycosylase family protein